MMIRYLLITGMMFVSQSVFSQESGVMNSSPESAAGRGEVSREWLDLQRSAEQSSLHEQRLAPAVQDRVYQRYLDSFEYPIPDNFYSRGRFVESR